MENWKLYKVFNNVEILYAKLIQKQKGEFQVFLK